jgi:hypothetical protein
MSIYAGPSNKNDPLDRRPPTTTKVSTPGSRDDTTQPKELIDGPMRRMGEAIRELAADLVKERRRRVLLQCEVRELRSRLAVYETADSRRGVEPQRST